MQWWNDLVDWLASENGKSVLVNALIPFLAIIVAGIIAAAIGRGSTKRLLALNDRENRVSAIATLIGAARRASVWNTLSSPEQQHADHVVSEADVRVRLLAVPGSGLAADWATHEIASMKRNSVSFSFQAEQSLLEFRDRMVTWQARPHRAKKLFKNDLDVWAYEDSQVAGDIVSQQQAWAAAQVSDSGPAHPGTSSVTDDATARSTERHSTAPTAVITPKTASAAAPVDPVDPVAPEAETATANAAVPKAADSAGSASEAPAPNGTAASRTTSAAFEPVESGSTPARDAREF